jgi:hypothetical protein
MAGLRLYIKLIICKYGTLTIKTIGFLILDLDVGDVIV